MALDAPRPAKRLRLTPTSPAPDPPPSIPPASKKEHTRRHATLYDAVAGRVPIRGIIPRSRRPPGVQKPLLASGASEANNSTLLHPVRTRDTLPALAPLSPADVLLKRSGAPDRFAEPDLDIYGAARWLPSRNTRADASGAWKEQQRRTELPDGEMLKAVHQYASFYYGRTGAVDSFVSLDETALLTVGILLQESWRIEVERGGWRALVEGDGGQRSVLKRRRVKTERRKKTVDEKMGVGADDQEKEVEEKKARKRRYEGDDDY